MSLLRLLAAGKSLVGLKQADSRYKVTSDRLLPQFESKKNPFRSRSDAVQNPPATLLEAAIRPRDSAPEELTDAGSDCCNHPKENSAKEGSMAAGKEESRSLADWASSLAGRITKGMHRPPAKSAKSAIPKLSKPLVQGELSLDRVKVVRNDLADTDLDIIRRKPEMSSNGLGSEVRKSNGTEPADSSWSRVAGRLFGTGKT